MCRKNLLIRINILTLCALILANVGFEGTAHASFWSSLVPTYTLSGKVVNQNQEPLEGVTMVFVSDGLGAKSSAVTDPLGNYVVNPLSKTPGMLTLSKDGYRIIRDKYDQWHNAGSQCIRNYNMSPDWISGKITDSDGTPLSGVKITFEQNGGISGVQTVFTDENGNYKYTLPADNKDYWVTISLEGYPTYHGKWDWVFGGRVYNHTLR